MITTCDVLEKSDLKSKSPYSLVNYSSSVDAAKVKLLRWLYSLYRTSSRHDLLRSTSKFALFVSVVSDFNINKVNPFISKLNFIYSPWFISISRFIIVPPLTNIISAASTEAVIYSNV